MLFRLQNGREESVNLRDFLFFDPCYGSPLYGFTKDDIAGMSFRCVETLEESEWLVTRIGFLKPEMGIFMANTMGGVVKTFRLYKSPAFKEEIQGLFSSVSSREEMYLKIFSGLFLNEAYELGVPIVRINGIDENRSVVDIYNFSEDNKMISRAFAPISSDDLETLSPRNYIPIPIV